MDAILDGGVRVLARLQTGYRFGPFRLCPEQRQLFAADRPVALKGRAFDLLSLLVTNRDRVVTKDEIFASVWTGATVSDNNLTVQMSTLRRILVAHGGDPAVIANVPGRGYRFVGEVEEMTAVLGTGAAVPPVALEHDAVLPTLAALPAVTPASRPVRLALPLGVSSLVAMVAAAVAFILFLNGGARMPDERLAIAVEQLQPDTPALAHLASAYTDAIVTQPIFFGDIRFFTAGGCGRGARYCLRGTVRATSKETLLSVRLTERASGLLVYGHDWPVSDALSGHGLSAAGHMVLAGLIPDLFRAELRAQGGNPRDALDWYVKASVETEGDDDPARAARGIDFLAEALRLDPAHKPSRLLLAALVLTRHSLSPAPAGNQDPQDVLRMMDDILLSEPRNPIALEDKALALIALDRPADAIAAACLALQTSPEDTSVLSALADAFIEGGLLSQASDLLGRHPDIDDGGAAASLGYARQDYPAVIPAVSRYQQGQSVDLQSNLMALLSVAAEWRLGHWIDADRLLRATLAALPTEFRRSDALRQTYYGLPPAAWNDFKAALGAAGMRP